MNMDKIDEIINKTEILSEDYAAMIDEIKRLRKKLFEAELWVNNDSYTFENDMKELNDYTDEVKRLNRRLVEADCLTDTLQTIADNQAEELKRLREELSSIHKWADNVREFFGDEAMMEFYEIYGDEE